MKFRRSTVFFASALALAGCKGGNQNQASAPSATDTQTAAAPPAVDENAATLSGVVKFAGTAPKAQKISMTADAYCKSQHATDVTSEDVVVNPNNTLKWVYVYVKIGLG